MGGASIGLRLVRAGLVDEIVATGFGCSPPAGAVDVSAGARGRSLKAAR